MKPSSRSKEHPSKTDVEGFMDAINVIINLRLESDRRSYQEPLVSGDILRKAADEMLKEAEYNLYELIDNALDKWTQDVVVTIPVKGGE